MQQRLVQTCGRSLQIHRESLGAEHPSSILEAARLTYALAKAVSDGVINGTELKAHSVQPG